MWFKLIEKRNGSIFNVKSRFIPNSYVATVTFRNFDVDWAMSFQRCRSTHLKLLYISKKYFPVWSKVLLNDDHKPKHRTQLIPKDMRVSLSTTVPRMSNTVPRKKAQKSHWVTGWNCLSFFKNKNKHGCVSFFQTFCHLIQWYAGLYEVVCRISMTSANQYLTVFMLACKSILLKCRLRDW